MNEGSGSRPEPERRRALAGPNEEKGLDVLLVVHPADVRYLSGFTGSSGWLLVEGDGSLFLTDHRYAEQAAEELEDVELLEPTRDRVGALADVADARGWGRVGFDPERTTVALLNRLEEAISGASWVPCPGWTARLRSRKSGEEIDAVRRSLEIAESALAELARELEPGWTERRVAAELEVRCRLAGADGMAFDTLVAAGPRSARPHGLPTDREIRAGEPVLVDLGCRRDGYCSDISRMVWPGGSVRRPWVELHEIVLSAQRAGLEAIAPGVPARDVDSAARAVIEEAGYGEAFGHGLGHGVGLEVHEEPALSPCSDDVLEAGMVVTVEPGIYLEGRGGVRVEEMVAVTGDGFVRLTVLSPEPILA